ncbi:transglutaminase-like cysteine peptidase [Bradyrhizobium sp. STM 3557]|uniref:transglutaminase-like cysteine peptidase n=1 Tax=Bradyrhizobium sp. STM 3557 TaxID=578920 RepID=UPI00388DAB4B
MDSLDRIRASLVAVLACAMICAAMATNLQAGPIAQPAGLAAARHSTEPFGLGAWDLLAGTLNDKWQALARKLDDERVQIALCDGDRERCASPAALRFLAIVDQGRGREGRARIGEINRAVNLALRPASDLAQYGEEDVWSSPLATFSRGAGDCEDYAIAKYVALRQAGLAARDLRVVILHDALHHEDHAVAAARLEGQWLLLDNQRMAMIEDTDARNVRPLFVIDENGIAKYDDGPLLVSAPEPLPTIAAAQASVATAE